MAQEEKLFDKKFVGDLVKSGTSRDRYDKFLLDGETVCMEFKGIRDALIFTDLRLILIDPQGILGRKVALSSIPWNSVTAFSVENSGTFDLDAELKLCGSGFGICELEFTKGTDMASINAFLSAKVLGRSPETQSQLAAEHAASPEDSKHETPLKRPKAWNYG